MANKPVTTDTATNAQYLSSRINSNFSIIENAIESCLGRGGTSESPNSMQGDLDMDLHKIINVGTPTNDNDAVRLVDLSDSDATGAASAQLRLEVIPKDTVAALKTSDLSSGIYINTKGFYSTGDGGDAIYIIKTAAEFGGTPDEYGDHTLNNGNVAVLQVNDSTDVGHYGALSGSTDYSASANAMVASVNYLRVPSNFTLTCKNVELFDDSKVYCDGTLRLPDSSSDFDRLLYAANRTDISIHIKEIDGNYSGQTGSIGTHLVYATVCDNIGIDVKYAHDHYISSSATMPSVDGIRDTSSGCIFVYDSDNAEINVGLIEGWGREGLQLRDCTGCNVTLGHAQGHATRNTEYSGLQVSGSHNKVNRASVDFCGASGVGFDTTDGILNNIISTNTRENHGVNFGHTGSPASNSVVSNIVVDGCFIDGIKVSSSTVDLVLDNFTVKNAGRFGISVSDLSERGKFSSGVIQNSGEANIQVLTTNIQTSNLRSEDLDEVSIKVTMTSGTFSDGETITAPGSKSAVVRKVIRDLTNAEEILFLNSVVGTFIATDVVTGGTSGAVGTVSAVNTPAQYKEQSGGIVEEEIRLFTGTQDQIRFPDGTAIMLATSSVVVATGGVLETLTTPYSSNVSWASAPRIVAQINNVSSTAAYTVSQLRVSSTTTQFVININASVAQTYGVSSFAIGRWK